MAIRVNFYGDDYEELDRSFDDIADAYRHLTDDPKVHRMEVVDDKAQTVVCSNCGTAIHKVKCPKEGCNEVVEL